MKKSKPRSTPAALTSTPLSGASHSSASHSSKALDQLFLDCAALETLLVSIRQGIDALDPAVEMRIVTPEHLMNLAFRIENAQHGLIAVAHQVSNTATTVIEQRKEQLALTSVH